MIPGDYVAARRRHTPMMLINPIAWVRVAFWCIQMDLGHKASSPHCVRYHPIFAIRFDGPRGLTISTDRHVILDDGATLTVTDRGFGNVLNGLEFNDTATALLGDRAVAFALDGAGPAVRAFRACTAGTNA